MQFDEQYPNKPPAVKFISQMFHPNVYATGELCLDILQNRWSPTYDVAAILTSVQRYNGSLWTRCQVSDLYPVFSTILIPAPPPTLKHRTSTKITAKNTPSACGKQWRRAGRTSRRCDLSCKILKPICLSWASMAAFQDELPPGFIFGGWCAVFLGVFIHPRGDHDQRNMSIRFTSIFFIQDEYQIHHDSNPCDSSPASLFVRKATPSTNARHPKSQMNEHDSSVGLDLT